MHYLVLLANLCGGPASLAGTAYLDTECHPHIGDYAYCPDADSRSDEEAECVVTHMAQLHSGHTIVRWEHVR